MTHNAWPSVPDISGLDCDGVRETVSDSPKFHGARNGAEHETLSDQALKLINGPRQARYGAPKDNLKAIGWMWGAMLGLDAPIPSFRVALMMSALKTCRASHEPTDDSLIDGAGYLELAKMLRPSGDSMWVGEGLVNRG